MCAKIASAVLAALILMTSSGWQCTMPADSDGQIIRDEGPAVRSEIGSASKGRAAPVAAFQLRPRSLRLEPSIEGEQMLVDAEQVGLVKLHARRSREATCRYCVFRGSSLSFT